MKKPTRKQFYSYLLIFCALFTLAFLFSRRSELIKAQEEVAVVVPKKIFSNADIKPFDGSDDSLPIYIGLNGLVYDVSAGREFYRIGGPYHFLAGRDSSEELNRVGGGIIKTKYPVVGKLIN
jgi:predicted heme/steroid binding protein